MTTTRRVAGIVAALTLAALLTACGTGPGSDAAPSPSTTAPAIDRPTAPIDELVPVGDRRLHVRCQGQGRATILLIAGWNNSSATWDVVTPTLAERARVCSYDRFGTGTSDAPAGPQTFETQVADLHALLDEVGEVGPYVVVGHSFGGAEAVTFASAHPDEVTGLVLVDASPATWPDTLCSVPAYQPACDLLHHPTEGERLDAFPAFEAVAVISSLGDLPMTVMTAVHRSADGITQDELHRLDALWRQGTERWASLSTASTVVTVDHTGHEIQVDRPTAVIGAVTDLLP